MKRVYNPINTVKRIGLFAIILFLSNNMLKAQSININRIDLFVENNVLYTRLHIQDFFDERLKETIASGMSRKVNLQFELFGSDQKPLYNNVESLNIKYDVWERIYLFNSAGEERQFDNFEKLMLFISDSTVFDLGSINTTEQNEQLQLIIIFSQQEISDRQQKELNSWMQSDAKTVESQPGVESNQSFSINISKLLSLFFSRESFADLYIYKSPLFTLKSLDKDENTPK